MNRLPIRPCAAQQRVRDEREHFTLAFVREKAFGDLN
jgi:hypothetical protein